MAARGAGAVPDLDTHAEFKAGRTAGWPFGPQLKPKDKGQEDGAYGAELAGRKPMSWARPPGKLWDRPADRERLALWYQAPPRTTRPAPDATPRGLVSEPEG